MVFQYGIWYLQYYLSSPSKLHGGSLIVCLISEVHMSPMCFLKFSSFCQNLVCREGGGDIIRVAASGGSMVALWSRAQAQTNAIPHTKHNLF